MKRSKYISILVLLLIATSMLFRLVAGVQCNCACKSHSSEFICIDITGDHHNHHHNHGYDDEHHDGCFHYQVSEYNAVESQLLKAPVVPVIALNLNLLSSSIILSEPILSADFDGAGYSRYKDRCHSRQWYSPALRRRPPPSVLL